jgi:hypothetical protein
VKPGKQENSVLFDKAGEIGIALSATYTYLDIEEHKLVNRLLRFAKEPYELAYPYSQVTIEAIRMLASSRGGGELGQAAKSMIDEYEAAKSAT